MKYSASVPIVSQALSRSRSRAFDAHSFSLFCALILDDAKMFARLSYVNEHLLWVWLQSPAAIAALDK
jgi:hypothetical protein